MRSQLTPGGRRYNSTLSPILLDDLSMMCRASHFCSVKSRLNKTIREQRSLATTTRVFISGNRNLAPYKALPIGLVIGTSIVSLVPAKLSAFECRCMRGPVSCLARWPIAVESTPTLRKTRMQTANVSKPQPSAIVPNSITTWPAQPPGAKDFLQPNNPPTASPHHNMM